MKLFTVFIAGLLAFTLTSSGAFADVIPTTLPQEENAPAPGAETAGLTAADIDYFTNNPDSIRVAGQTNTWYQNTGGVLWLLATAGFIAAMVAAT